MVDPSAPQSLRELLEFCRTLGASRWGIWEVTDAGRHVYYGRLLIHPTGRFLGARARRPWHFDVVCVRCGRGWKAKGWKWTPAPTGYVPLHWISLCYSCLCFWAHVWPEVFPRFRLGIVLYQWRRETVASTIPNLDRHAFHQHPPFGPPQRAK